MTPLSRREFLKGISLPLSTLLFSKDRNAYLGQGTNSNPPNIVILVFDALSAKNMSLYGYPRATTPELARFAERATVYHAHYAAGNFTTPGTASLLTGTYPWSHRAFHLFGRIASDRKHRNLFRSFAGKGYRRIAYTHNWVANFLLCQFETDLDTHFDPHDYFLSGNPALDNVFPGDKDVVYRSLLHTLPIESRQTFPASLFLSLANKMIVKYSERDLVRQLGSIYPRGLPREETSESYFTLEQAIDQIQEVVSVSPKPFLAYFHLYPPHGPYRPRREFIGRFKNDWKPTVKPPHLFSMGITDKALNQNRMRYDEFVAHVDSEFGRLYDFMRHIGLLDNTCIVVTSDHGEMFERGILSHPSRLLYEPLIRIPLLISRPNQSKREDVHTPSSCVDVLPTLLGLTGQALPAWCEGEILPVHGSKVTADARSIFSIDAQRSAQDEPFGQGTIALVKGKHKLIHYFGYPGFDNKFELYDLANDPEELVNRYSPGNSLAVGLQSELKAKLLQVNQPYFNS